MVKWRSAKKEGYNIQIPGVIFKRVTECLLRKFSTDAKFVITSKV